MFVLAIFEPIKVLQKFMVFFNKLEKTSITQISTMSL
jgi:hypothetical protein